MYKNKKKSFNALCWHYDEAENLPKEAKVLASNKISKFQSISFEVNKSSVWAVQYHPDDIVLPKHLICLLQSLWIEIY